MLLHAVVKNVVSEPRPTLRLHVLGRFRWSLDERPLPEPSPIGKAALTYLLVHAGEAVCHEELEALFAPLTWPSPDIWMAEAEALARCVPPSILRLTPKTLRMTRHVRSDLHDATVLLEPPLTANALQRAWLLLGSELLEGLDLYQHPIWNVWLRSRRERLERHLSFVTERIGAHAVVGTPDTRDRRGLRLVH